MSLLWTDRTGDPKTPRFPGWHWKPSLSDRIRDLWWRSRDLRAVLVFLLTVGMIALCMWAWLQIVWVAP